MSEDRFIAGDRARFEVRFIDGTVVLQVPVTWEGRSRAWFVDSGVIQELKRKGTPLLESLFPYRSGDCPNKGHHFFWITERWLMWAYSRQEVYPGCTVHFVLEEEERNGRSD